MICITWEELDYSHYVCGDLGFPLCYGTPWELYDLDMCWLDTFLCDNYDKYPVSEGYPATIDYDGITLTQMSGQRYSYTKSNGETAFCDLTQWDNFDYYTALVNPPSDYIYLNIYFGYGHNLVRSISVNKALYTTEYTIRPIIAKSTLYYVGYLVLNAYDEYQTVKLSYVVSDDYVENLIEFGILTPCELSGAPYELYGWGEDPIYMETYNGGTVSEYSGYTTFVIPFINFQNIADTLNPIIIPDTYATYSIKYNIDGTQTVSQQTNINTSENGGKTAHIKLSSDKKTINVVLNNKIIGSYTHKGELESVSPSSFTITSGSTSTVNIIINAAEVEPEPIVPPFTGIPKITLFKNISESNRLDKTDYLTKISEISGTLRDETSVLKPSVDIYYEGTPNFNYVYINAFSRYYYVTGITSVRQNLWRIDLSVDVLMSYKDEILNLTAHIDRNEQFSCPLIPDTERSIMDGQEVYEIGCVVPTDKPAIVTSATQVTERNAYCMVVNGYRLTVKELN